MLGVLAMMFINDSNLWTKCLYLDDEYTKPKKSIVCAEESKKKLYSFEAVLR